MLLEGKCQGYIYSIYSTYGFAPFISYSLILRRKEGRKKEEGRGKKEEEKEGRREMGREEEEEGVELIFVNSWRQLARILSVAFSLVVCIYKVELCVWHTGRGPKNRPLCMDVSV